jgi:glycosyltransferase involved in cell wall biosynthesis
MAMPASAPQAGVQRIAFVCPAGAPLHHLRETLFADLLVRGHRLLVVATELSGADVCALDDLGADHAVFSYDPTGLKLLADWKAIGGLKLVLSDWGAHVVVAYGARTMVYGALAAKNTGAGRIVLIVDRLPEHRFAGVLAADEMPAWRYGQALQTADEVVFHNREDLALLKKLGVVPDTLAVAVVAGGGADVDGQAILPLPALGQGLVFLMIASLERRRGVIEYCEAAALLRRRAPSSRFLLAGMPGEAEAAIAPEEVRQYADVEYVGAAAEHPGLLGQCHVFVYPACVGETPQPVLQAMAGGRPILTTNVVGCRDTVDERVNGCLVAPRDPVALAEAMESFLKRPDLIPAMARASRAKAERLTSVDAVKRSLLDALRVD